MALEVALQPPAEPSRRLKVLVSAYACNPYRGSEEGVGWGWVKMIASRHDVHVLTAAYHAADIDRALAEDAALVRSVRFHYVRHRPWHYRPSATWRRIEGSWLKPIMNCAYRLWERDAFKLGRRLHEEVQFDLVHLVTYVGFRFPGHLWKLDVPFVWGPIGGLENTPWRLLPMMGLQGCIYYVGRNILNSLDKALRLSPRKAFRRASRNGAIIAATSGIQREIKRCYGHDSQVICEIGTPDCGAARPTERQVGEPLRIAWSGLHLPGKALPLLLRALTKVPAGLDWRLDILGEGPCSGRWRRLAGTLGLSGKCQWHGSVPRDEAVALVHDAHVFVITSLKDLTSTVLLEALSQGVPVVCLDHCGFHDVVTEDCGIKVPVTSRQAIQSGIAAAIAKLATGESLRMGLARGSLARVADFSWEKKVQMVSSIYQRAVAAEAPADDDRARHAVSPGPESFSVHPKAVS